MIEFFKKVFKNKLLVISICIVLICILFVVARKIIDDYESGVYGASVTEGIDSSDGEGEWTVRIRDAVLARGIGESGDAVGDGDYEQGLLESGEHSEESEINDDLDFGMSENEDMDFSSAVGKIFVHVAGEVNNPGVVSLNDDARIVDAINAAGGTTPNAEISKVNLAYVLKDGMKLNIPNKNQLNYNEHFAYIIIGSGNTDNIGYSASDFYMSGRKHRFF